MIERSTVDNRVLYIDTANQKPVICLDDLCCSIPADAKHRRTHIIETIEKVVAKASCTLSDITCIELNQNETSFTQARITVAIVNALAKAHNIPVRYTGSHNQRMILPRYSGKPHITVKI